MAGGGGGGVTLLTTKKKQSGKPPRSTSREPNAPAPHVHLGSYHLLEGGGGGVALRGLFGSHILAQGCWVQKLVDVSGPGLHPNKWSEGLALSRHTLADARCKGVQPWSNVLCDVSACH